MAKVIRLGDGLLYKINSSICFGAEKHPCPSDLRKELCDVIKASLNDLEEDEMNIPEECLKCNCYREGEEKWCKQPLCGTHYMWERASAIQKAEELGVQVEDVPLSQCEAQDVMGLPELRKELCDVIKASLNGLEEDEMNMRYNFDVELLNELLMKELRGPDTLPGTQLVPPSGTRIRIGVLEQNHTAVLFTMDGRFIYANDIPILRSSDCLQFQKMMWASYGSCLSDSFWDTF